MKSTTSILALAAAVAPFVLASPFHMERHAEAQVVDYVTDTAVVTKYAQVTEYATAGAEVTTVVSVTASPAPSTSQAPEKHQNNNNNNKDAGHHWSWTWSSTSTSAPAAPSTTSVQAAPIPTTTSTSSSSSSSTSTSSTTQQQPSTTAWIAPSVPATSSAAQAVSTAAQAAVSAISAYTGDASYSASNMQAAIINSTNVWRKTYHASPMVWNSTLASNAQKVQSDSDTKCSFDHNGAVGQNLGTGYAGPQAAVDSWGSEYDKVDFNNPQFTEQTGHFTQLVWQDSTSVGCAAQYCDPKDPKNSAQGWFLICNFYPVGNMLGEFKDNVKGA